MANVVTRAAMKLAAVQRLYYPVVPGVSSRGSSEGATQYIVPARMDP